MQPIKISKKTHWKQTDQKKSPLKVSWYQTNPFLLKEFSFSAMVYSDNPKWLVSLVQ